MPAADWREGRIKSPNKGKMFGLKWVYKAIPATNEKDSRQQEAEFNFNYVKGN